jgi:hypothetical protein
MPSILRPLSVPRLKVVSPMHPLNISLPCIISLSNLHYRMPQTTLPFAVRTPCLFHQSFLQKPCLHGQTFVPKQSEQLSGLVWKQISLIVQTTHQKMSNKSMNFTCTNFSDKSLVH